MVDGTARIDAADDAVAGPLDQSRPPDENVHLRLVRLADGHPSSPRYDGGSDWPGGDDGRAESAHGDDLAEASDQAAAERPAADDATGDEATAGEAAGDAGNGSGWRAPPDVRDHPDLPEPDDVRLTADRAEHILSGDGPGTLGGGHRHGAGRPGKTEFPANWSDDMIVSTVQDVARNPDRAQWQESNSRWNVGGERDGVGVKAIVLPDGRIWAAWPSPGGAGVIQNPKG